MEYQSSLNEPDTIVTGDSEQGSEQGSIYVTGQVMNELREKINHLQYELEYLKGRDTVPINSLFQDDLNKIKTGLKVCSNVIQSTNNLFKTSDKKNTEMSNEIKALKREVNKRFDEEKDLRKRRNELLDFLHEGMGNLENRTKQLDNEMKNVWNGLKEEHEQVKAASTAIQSIKDFLKNSGNRITETSNEVRTLKEHIMNGFLVNTETFDDGSFLKKEDLAELRNGMFNVYGNGIQQVQERSKQQDNEIKDVWEGLKKLQEIVEIVVISVISIKSLHKDTNGKQIILDNRQRSNEIRKLQLELKAEQQKNIILENKLKTVEYHLEEILQINDIKQNPSKETCIKTTITRNSASQRSDSLTETGNLTMSDSQMKENKPSQMDMPLKFLIEDYGWSDSALKGPDGVGFNEEAKKSEYVGKGVNQRDVKEQETIDSLQQKEKALYEQESSTSLVYCQTDELNGVELDLLYDCSSGKDGALSYLEKAHAYLQNLQMPGMFTFSDEENFAVSDEESSAVSEKENLVTFEPGNYINKPCGRGKKETNEISRKDEDRIRDVILSNKIEWVIRCNVATMKDQLYQSSVFYTGKPGYRLQLLAKIDRPEGEIFFCLKVLKGVYDENLNWPCQQGISIKTSKKMQSTRIEYWFIPEKDVLTKPKNKSNKVYTQWLGPFDLSHLNSEKLIFDIYLIFGI